MSAPNHARRNAHKQGLRTYRNAKPCAVCGTFERRTSTYACLHCVRAYKQEYDKTHERKPRSKQIRDGVNIEKKREQAWQAFHQALQSDVSSNDLRHLLREWERWDVRAAMLECSQIFFNPEIIKQLEVINYENTIQDGLRVRGTIRPSASPTFEYTGHSQDYSSP